MTESTPSTDETVVVQERMTRRGCAWRLGCVLIWLPLMLLPLALFVLAVQGELALWHGGNFPSGAEHPFLQAKLLMDVDTRGLNITRSYISTATDTSACVQTQVRFVLWQGQGDPVDYCDCYLRDSADGAWTFQSTAAGQCQ